jgi:hypothetical protein
MVTLAPSGDTLLLLAQLFVTELPVDRLPSMCNPFAHHGDVTISNYLFLGQVIFQCISQHPDDQRIPAEEFFAHDSGHEGVLIDPL